MSARSIYEPRPVIRPKAARPTIEVNVNNLNVIGTQPILSIIVDAGPESPVYVIKLDTVQQIYVHRKIGTKLPGAQHE